MSRFVAKGDSLIISFHWLGQVAFFSFTPWKTGQKEQKPGKNEGICKKPEGTSGRVFISNFQDEVLTRFALHTIIPFSLCGKLTY